LTVDTSDVWKIDYSRMNPSNIFKFDSLEIFRTDNDTTRILTYYSIDREISIAKRIITDEVRIDTVNRKFIHQFRDSIKILL
jgi:hypothetical protein